MTSRRAFLLATASLAIVVPSEGAWALQVEDPGLVLESLAGEWSVVAEATLGPGQEPVREIIEIQDADHHVIRSLIFGPNGEWFEFARAEHRRVGPP